MRPGSGRASRLLAAALSVAAGAACDQVAPGRLLARQAVLRKQIDDLERRVQAAEAGGLLRKDKLMVAIGEATANDLARLALPKEQVLPGGLRIRLETADIRFRSEQGSVRFGGRLGPAQEEVFFADAVLLGVVDTVDVDRATGVLRLEVAVTSLEITRVLELDQMEAIRPLLAELGQQGGDALKALAFPIQIPVQLDQEIALKEVSGGGPVKLAPARLPLRLTVAEVAAHEGRLWVAVDVSPLPRQKAAVTAAGS